jgi:conserved oligomeric Golgi complex subunit 1
MAMLQNCPLIIQRHLKKDGSLLLAAKILVLARLLHKTLSQPSTIPPVVDKFRDQLGSLRRRLLVRIDGQLARATDSAYLAEVMSAFALITSSTPTDVLKHFQHVRLESIKLCFESYEDLQKNIPKALQTFVRTLREIQAIFPRLLSQSLAKLKMSALIQNADVQGVTELNLPVHERWISDEVRQYTPWPRHDELQKVDAEKLLKSWARQAVSTVIEGTQRTLSKVDDLDALVRLRQEMIEIWLASSSHAPGLDPLSVLDDLRETINGRFHTAVRQTVMKLGKLVARIDEALQAWAAESHQQPPLLWELSNTANELENGAIRFKRIVYDRTRGCGELELSLIEDCIAWTQCVQDVRRIVKEMKDIRWDDYIEDEDDETDDVGFESKQTMLSEDDPRDIEETLNENLTQLYKNLQTELHTLVKRLTEMADIDEDVVSGKLVFLLRILREMDQQLAKTSNKSSPASVFSTQLIHPLHQKLGSVVAQFSGASFEASMHKIMKAKHCYGRALWDGNPQLPLQPTPASFKFLSVLSQRMANAGADVWSPGATKALKQVLSKHVEISMRKVHSSSKEQHSQVKNNVQEVSREDTGIDLAKSDESNTLPSSEIVYKDKTIQLVFDAAYLQCALSYNDEHHGFTSIINDLSEQAELDDSSKESLKKSAAEYWKKTYLLFSLLR